MERERDGDTEERKERQVGKRESRSESEKKKRAVKAADACHQCNGNFQWLKGGEEVGTGGDGEWEREREKERVSE